MPSGIYMLRRAELDDFASGEKLDFFQGYFPALLNAGKTLCAQRSVEYMCDIGISSRDSLFFATASAADLMRLSDQGRIKEGNSADLVLCDGDALADIKRAARKENHRMVVKRGVAARDNRAAFVRQATRVAAE